MLKFLTIFAMMVIRDEAMLRPGMREISKPTGFEPSLE
jgi:hypothetical protein